MNDSEFLAKSHYMISMLWPRPHVSRHDFLGINPVKSKMALSPNRETFSTIEIHEMHGSLLDIADFFSK